MIDWLFHRKSTKENYRTLERLNSVVQELDKAGATNPASRFLGEIHNIRKIVTRVGVISRTGFLTSGYALLDVLVIAAMCLRLFQRLRLIGPFWVNTFSLDLFLLIYSYMARLISGY